MVTVDSQFVIFYFYWTDACTDISVIFLTVNLFHHIRNEFNLNVHVIMNTSVSCKVSEALLASR